MRNKRNSTEARIGRAVTWDAVLVLFVLALTTGCKSMNCATCPDSYNNAIPAPDISVDGATNMPTNQLGSRAEQTPA
jgi:hypothetical protein